METIGNLSQESLFLVVGGGLILLAGLLLLLAVVFFIRQRRMEKKLEIFFSGKDAKNLETVILDQKKEILSLDRDIQEIYAALEKLRAVVVRSIHKVSVLRFNPFQEKGGNQSFSVALLDGRNSGITFSSLHTREGTRVYAKPVEGGTENGFPLTEEEKQVIHQALSGSPAATGATPRKI